MTQIADKVYRNAKVYSIALDGKETHAEAVAIKDGKFVYVGDEAGHSRMDRRYHRNRRLPRKERPPRTCRRAHAPCTRCGIETTSKHTQTIRSSEAWAGTGHGFPERCRAS